MPLFNVTNLVKEYPRSRFKLEVPQLSLHAGSITGVVGENGNGKTTLLDIVAGESKSNGDFTYFGKEVNHDSPWLQLKNDIGFIPQRIPRWFGSLEENLYLKGGLEGIPKKQIEDELNTLLDFLDLQQYRKLKWTEISTGYRLRFELARILLGRPKILVLDEPLANLDINTQQKFLSDLKILLNKRDEPLTVILSSQQLHEIESVADQMMFLRKGKVVFRGSLDDIEQSESNFLYEIQIDGQTEEELMNLFNSEGETISNVGPYLQLTTTKNSNEVLSSMIAANIKVKYFRNLSKSTKRFFSN